MTTASGILKMYRYVVMVFVPFFFLCQFPFTVLQAQSISGTVYNDVNGLTDNQVNGTAMGNPNGATLYASLSNASGLVIQTVAIAANGNFQFNSLASGTYHIQISVNAGSIGQPLPGVVLPFGWIITGEFLGAGAGSDGNPNGTLNSIILGSTPLTNAFFGIEQRPSAGTYSFVPQVNPGGPAMVPVDPSAFSGSDPSGGFITAIRLNNFPNNAAGLTINGIFYNSATFPAGGITIPATSTGQPLQPILIDPLNGNSTAEIYYLVIDNALKASQFYGLVSMPFYTISLGGTVWNDVNGLSDNTVNGIAIGAPSSVPLFVNALNSSGNVIAVSSVNAAGTFLFPQIDPGTYSLQLNTLAGTLASAPPAQVLPTNWVFTGEYAGTGAGSDGLVNGILASVTLVNSTINNAQFGIEERPTAIAGVASSQVNPGLNTVAPVDPTAFGGSDASSGYLTAIHIISFPANANGLQLNSVLYTATSFPVSGVWVPCNPTGQPLQPVGIDPVDGVVTVSLQFSVSDNAGFESLNQATTSFSFFSISIAGQVVNDVNGLTDNTVNTSPGANAIPSALYINLLTPAGYVVASTPVLANGSFEFPTMNAGTYAVQLSMYSGIAGLPAPASQLPNGWIFTGEFVGTGPGSDAMADGILTPVLAGSVNIQDIHMGIEEYGTPAVLSTVGQVNPGYGILIPVAPNLFAGTDPSGGSIQGLNITGFPTNVDSLFVNGIAYNASNFPSNGIFIPAAGNGNSLWPISFDPVDGAVSVHIPYSVIDNAGKSSPATGSANIPFYTIHLSGTVFNDMNGVSDNTVFGAPLPAVSTQQYYAVLIQSGLVVQSVTLDTNSVFLFNEVHPGTYSVQVGTLPGIPGNPPPATLLPLNWVYSGEFLGTGAGNDGMADGQLQAIPMLNYDVDDAFFSLQERPHADTQTHIFGANPGTSVCASIVSAWFGGTDADTGYLSYLKLINFPSNAESIEINGISYTSFTFPSGGISIPCTTTGEPIQNICVNPQSGAQLIELNYTVYDNAGFESLDTGYCRIQFYTLQLGGTIWNDVNGLTDFNVNGFAIPSAGASVLYVHLLNSSHTVVMQSIVDPLGHYLFSGLDGGTYHVQIGVNAYASGQVITAGEFPPAWVATGEQIGTGPGHDGLPNGLLENILLQNADILDANLAMEELPQPQIHAATLQPNIGATVESTVAPSLFVSTDNNGGTITSLRIIAFPEHAQSIRVNGMLYSSSTFPTSGLLIPVNSSGQPAVSISADPVDGIVSVDIPFKSTDNAGMESQVTGYVRLPYSMPLPDFNVAYTGLVISGNVSTNDKVPAGTSYATAIAAASNPSSAIPVVNSNGTYSFQTSIAGKYFFDVPVLCPGGGYLPIQLLIHVLGAGTNQPLAHPEVASTLEGMPVMLNALVNDGCGQLICALNFSTLSVLVQPAHGQAIANPSGGFILYTPNPGFLGGDTLYYRICDNNSSSLCDTTMQIIQVLPLGGINTTMASDDYVMTPFNTGASGNLLLNDIDPEHQNQTAGMQNITISGKGSLGVLPNGSYYFTPVNGYTGQIDFPYEVCDNSSTMACANATLHVLVYPAISLPVDLVLFEAGALHCESGLHWITASERQSCCFEIQRKKIPSGAFIPVTRVQAAGYSDVATHYYYTDSALETGQYEYRLKCIDIDSQFQYSDIAAIQVTCAPFAGISVYPNPASEQLNISFTNSSVGIYHVQLTNALAQTAVQSTFSYSGGKQQIILQTAYLPDGLYMLRISDENQISTITPCIIHH